MLVINETLRLRPISKLDYKIALDWYQDPYILYYSEGTDQAYDLEMISKMYDYLNDIGRVYFIEYYEDEWIPIGDVTYATTCMPIVINKAYRHKGIGKLVINYLLNYGYSIGDLHFKLSGIYPYNHGSIKMYKACGFKEYSRDEKKVYMEFIW